jgi:hypothetical protein
MFEQAVMRSKSEREQSAVLAPAAFPETRPCRPDHPIKEAVMVRTRALLLVLAGSLMTSAGCQTCSSDRPLLSRLFRPSAPEYLDAGPVINGPMLTDPGPMIVPAAPPANGTTLTPPTPFPSNQPPPPARIVPQPQAQPQPYNPPR